MSVGEITWPDVGQLTRRVLIRLWLDNPGSMFGIEQDFDNGTERWAKIEPVSGVAFWGSKQIDEGMTHRIWIRYGIGTRPENLTGQHVIDYMSGNERFRVLRATNVGDAQKFTMIEVKSLGKISA